MRGAIVVALGILLLVGAGTDAATPWAGPRAAEDEPRMWFGPQDWRARLDDRVNAVASHLKFEQGRGWSKCLRARVGWRMATALYALSGQLTARRRQDLIAASSGLPVVSLNDHKNHRHQIRVWEEYVEKACKDGSGLGSPPSSTEVSAAWSVTTHSGFWASYRREREEVRRAAEDEIQRNALNVSLAFALQRPGGIAIGAQPTETEAAALAAALLSVGVGVALSPEVAAWIPWVLATVPATGGRTPKSPRRPVPPRPEPQECGGPPPPSRGDECEGRARQRCRCVPPWPGHWECSCETPG